MIIIKNKKMQLGQKVIVSKKYQSFLNREKQTEWHTITVKRYKIIDIPSKDGIFVGVRVLKEAEVNCDEINILNSIKVALVATDLRGLIYVPIESLICK